MPLVLRQSSLGGRQARAPDLETVPLQWSYLRSL